MTKWRKAASSPRPAVAAAGQPKLTVKLKVKPPTPPVQPAPATRTTGASAGAGADAGAAAGTAAPTQPKVIVKLRVPEPKSERDDGDYVPGGQGGSGPDCTRCAAGA